MLDYDAVILGGSLTGRYAAILAAQMQGRVALVEPPETAKKSLIRFNQALIPIGKTAEQIRQATLFGLASATGTLNWQNTLQWIDDVTTNCDELYSLNQLASLGVDVISGQGTFINKPDLAFIVNNRKLRSRTYLLALPSQPRIPNIEGLDSSECLTEETLSQFLKKPDLFSQDLPLHLAIIGGSPTGVELAQTLNRLGLNITLIVKGNQILGKEEPEVIRLVQAQLEAEGVRIFTQTPVIQVKTIDHKKWIQAGNKAIEVDEILIAAGHQVNLEYLNLELVGVKLEQGYLQLNEKLQTTNPRIYACGEVIGGYPFAQIAYYEAQIALKNALYWPQYTVDYQAIPWTIFSDPSLARVGLTEAQAKRRYGNQVIVERQDFKRLAQAQLGGETTGFCKLVALSNGKILGATVVGSQASEFISTLALAIRHGIKLDTLAELPAILPSFSEAYHQTAIAWLNQRRLQNTRLYDWIENLFHWRRYWKN